MTPDSFSNVENMLSLLELYYCKIVRTKYKVYIIFLTLNFPT